MAERVSFVGGGVARLTLGIGLRPRSVQVTVWEAGRYPNPRVCDAFIRGRWKLIQSDAGLTELYDVIADPDEKTNLALAHRYWDEEVKGGNSFVQRAQRLVFKVPHYKTGEELAKAVAEAKARKP